MNSKPAGGLSSRQVGRYTICGQIASGGMATVHLAHFAGPLGFSGVTFSGGFDVVDVRNRPDAAFHFGLETLVERVHVAGGHAHITSTPGSGTRVTFALPIADTSGQSPEPLSRPKAH